MRSRYRFVNEEGIYFVTSTVVEWLPIFTRKRYFEIILQSLTFCRHHKGLSVFAYVVLDNHLHLIVCGKNLSQILQDFKGFTAREVVRIATEENRAWLLNQLAFYRKKYKTTSKYQVWQEGSHLN